MLTKLIVILDKSGSMLGVQDATLSALNEYLQTLKNDGNKYQFSLTLFDTEVTRPIVNKDLAEVEELTRKDYEPNGLTALYDAVCQTLKDAKVEKDEKALVVIMTDGQENASREYGRKDMHELIKRLEGAEDATEASGWTFVYLGANQDAYAEATQLGIAKGNIANFHASAGGLKATMANVAQATSRYGASSLRSTGAFYSAQERKEIEETQ